MDEDRLELSSKEKETFHKIILDILNGLNLCMYQLDEVGRVGIRSVFLGPVGSRRKETFNRAVLLLETVKQNIKKLNEFSQKHPFSEIFNTDDEIINLLNNLFRIDFYSFIEPLRRNKSARTIGLRIKTIYNDVKVVYDHIKPK